LRSGGGEGEGEGEGGGGTADMKSNNPHLTGGEKKNIYIYNILMIVGISGLLSGISMDIQWLNKNFIRPDQRSEQSRHHRVDHRRPGTPPERWDNKRWTLNDVLR